MRNIKLADKKKKKKLLRTVIQLKLFTKNKQTNPKHLD